MMLLLGVVVSVCPAAAVPAQDAEGVPKTDPKKVPAGINVRFRDPALNVDTWLDRFEVESREVYAGREAVLRACAVAPGEEIADVGAGTGFYSRLFAKATGWDGWVYAVDIAPRFLQHIAERATADGIENLTCVLGTDASIRLPPNSLDLVFVCDTYHHFEDPPAMLASIRRALRPGGRLILIDFERIPGKSREFILGHVRAGKQVFRAEVEQAGFVFDEEIEMKDFEENYLLRFHRPD